MRPRKKVLVLADSEARLCEWRFLLDMHGWRVLCARRLDEALPELGLNHDCTVAVVLAANPDWVATLQQVRCETGLVSVLLAGVLAVDAFGTTADAVVVKQKGATSLVLDRLQILTARKRGPRSAEVWPERGAGVGEAAAA